jgi:hypothetical protein
VVGATLRFGPKADFEEKKKRVGELLRTRNGVGSRRRKKN